MPTFIVRHANEQPRFATVEGPMIIIGRDRACTVVLPEPTVSRQHLVIREYPGPQYVIDGVKLNNPVMLNGSFIRERVALAEGDELQIADFHVIFSLRRDAKQHYIKEVSHYDGVCNSCRWQGRMGSHNPSPKCPACGAGITERKDDLSSVGVRAISDHDGGADTSYMASVDVAKMHELLRLKTKARLKKSGTAAARLLNPNKPSTLGASGRADFSADGLLFGGSAVLAWEDDAWVARWTGLICRMKHNGDSTKLARLKPGDRLTIGSSDFELTLD